MTTLTIDGAEYEMDDLSDEAKALVASIQEIDKTLIQLNNELAITDSARLSYNQRLRGLVRNVTPVQEPED